MNNAIKIAVADNHKEYREALSGLLAGYGFTIVLSAGVGPGLLSLIDPAHPPDVIIISCSTIHPESIGLIGELKNKFPSIKLLANVVFMHYLPETEVIREAVDGVIIKTMTGPEAIEKAILKACGRL